MFFPTLAFAEPGTASVEVDGKTYDVNYDQTGLTVDGIEADTTTSSLTVFVTTTDVEGTLVISLERSFFDSMTEGVDEDFLVLLDGGDDAVFDETKTDSERTLTIIIPSGTSSLDILALGSTGFTSLSEPEEITEPETTEPEEITEPETTEPEEITEPESEATPEPEETTEPQIQCGPGTVLQDGICVLEQIESKEESMEEPKAEPAAEQKQDQTCGPGTVLQDGVCVLDQTCGPGTIYKDGQCVLEESTSVSSSTKSATFQLVAPAVAAFVIAFVIMIILWAIGKAGRQKK
jgi:hypothetical protein